MRGPGATALTRRLRGDTSPLPGLAHVNAVVCGVNVFAPSGLHCFPARPVPAPLAYANVLIPWHGRFVCAPFKTVVASQVSPLAGEQAKQDFTRRPLAERLPAPTTDPSAVVLQRRSGGRSRTVPRGAGPERERLRIAPHFPWSGTLPRTSSCVVRAKRFMGAAKKKGSPTLLRRWRPPKPQWRKQLCEPVAGHQAQRGGVCAM
jgi:hypothetical protein